MTILPDAPAAHPTSNPAQVDTLPGTDVPRVPARADGIELFGETPGTGYRTPPSLARRADGQVLQLTPLLYATLRAVDGRRDHHAIAAEVSDRTGRLLSADDALYLVEAKLRPLGVLSDANGVDGHALRANPLLALRLRYIVSDPRITNRITAPFGALFRPPIVLGVLAAFLAIVWWIMFDKGLGGATHEAFHDPRLLLLVVGLTLLSAGFHEFGHAAACRYGGASPGAMGVGLYLIWPAFYTEVTDSYRLGRLGRLRVDLGGLYFNAVFSVAVFGLWAASRWDALLLVIAAQVLQMLRQLLPLVRFDGYHILADLTGVPDLFRHIAPTLTALLPSRWRHRDPHVLKPWTRVVVTLWVLVVVPVLAAVLLAILWILPRLAATAWESLDSQRQVLAQNWADGAVFDIAVRLLSMAAISIPVASMAYLLARIVHRIALRLWRATEQRPATRIGVAAAGLVAAGSLIWAWTSAQQYEPVTPADRGVIQDLLPIRQLPAPEDGTTAAPALAVPSPTIPTDHDGAPAVKPGPPQLALVRVPREADIQPAATRTATPAPPANTPHDRGDWPFPWAPPAEAGPDDNRAMAVNTRDGQSVYDVAIAFVWDTGEEAVQHRNEAYALAQCVDCTTIAVAFQVVMIIGEHRDVAPANVAVAANHACERCTTQALAAQLVATLRQMPAQTTVAQLQRIWQSLNALEGQDDNLTLAEIHALVKDAEAETLALLTETGDMRAATVDEAEDDTEPRTAEAGEDAPEARDDEADGGADSQAADAEDQDDAAAATTANEPTDADAPAADDEQVASDSEDSPAPEDDPEPADDPDDTPDDPASPDDELEP